ncbi:GNAT family N-acetyltransferase [Aquibacillus rhizosphaerae]|uniref:GNAT family N-acetyltransferase n=1 Tax=Aquibacillus rhizosphaerae TaxID=3051431 RepID=A0ABT7L8H7_9BACI|nr:GNAT family N-acetyltransferase [Aquibacillus sp. LR5S19]MDL4842190.1 GNAT family N-acetyltransferase [Aquibacillus sp. LR5S19]
MYIKPLIKEEAKLISTWKYEDIYSLYNLSDSKEGIDELLNGTFYGCKNSKSQLIGYYCFGNSALVPGGISAGLYQETALDIGLAMNPSYTGKGFGQKFVEAGVGFAITTFQPIKLRLSVAMFNQRAITVYKRVGFICGKQFINNGNTFLIMEYPVQ